MRQTQPDKRLSSESEVWLLGLNHDQDILAGATGTGVVAGKLAITDDVTHGSAHRPRSWSGRLKPSYHMVDLCTHNE